MIYNIYNSENEPFFGLPFIGDGPYPGVRKVSRKVVAKRRAANKAASQARKANRKGLGKARWHWSVKGGYTTQRKG